MKRTILLAVLAAGVAAPAMANGWSWRAPAGQYVSQYAPPTQPAVQPTIPMTVSAPMTVRAPMAAPCRSGPIVSTAYARPCGPVWGGGGGGLSFNAVVAHYERWLNHFEAQIRTGEMSGRLIRAEANRARMRQQEIARLLGDARADNQVSPAENQRLGLAVERQARRLERLTGNYRRMYGAAGGAVPPVNMGRYRFNLGGGAAPASARSVTAAATPASATTASAASGGSEQWLNW